LGLSTHCELFCGLLASGHGSDVLDHLLARAIRGEIVGCVASTEPSGGSSIRRPVSRADMAVDGGWHVTAEKWFITNAAMASHAIISTSAFSGAGALGHTLFVVGLDDPAVTRTGSFETVGMRACDTSTFVVDGTVTDQARLGRPGTGLVLLSKALQMERLLASRQVLTAARQAMVEATDFLRTRIVDGQPLLQRQALRHRLADCSAHLLAAEALLGNVVRRLGAGAIVEREIAATKLVATRVACEITDECLQFLGGRGYTTDYAAERIWRDTRIARIGGGSDEVMREVIASSHDRDAEPPTPRSAPSTVGSRRSIPRPRERGGEQ
jgi:alkylation response protein AidB-like acyl-CoA dehydrogenase